MCLDSNICIYRSLNRIEPKIFDKRLNNATKLINDVTNTNYSCNILLLKTVINEIITSDDEAYILSNEIQHFGTKILGLKPYSYKLKQMEATALKSLRKFVDKYSYNIHFKGINFSYCYLSKIETFYLQFPQKLFEITQKKLSFIKDIPKKQRKINQRPNNLPEYNDLKIFNECLELNDKCNNHFYIISNDSDFIDFSNEINIHFNISIFDFKEYNQQ